MAPYFIHHVMSTPDENALIIRYRYYHKYGWAKIVKLLGNIGNNRSLNYVKNVYTQYLG